MKGEAEPCGDEGSSESNLMAGATSGSASAGAVLSQQLKWQAHMVESWHGICDGALQDM